MHDVLVTQKMYPSVSTLTVQPNCYEVFYNLEPQKGPIGPMLQPGIRVGGHPFAVYCGMEFLKLHPHNGPRVYKDFVLRGNIHLDRSNPKKPLRWFITAPACDGIFVKISTGERRFKKTKVNHRVIGNLPVFLSGKIRSVAGDISSVEELYRLKEGQFLHIVFVDGIVCSLVVKDGVPILERDPQMYEKLRAETEAKATAKVRVSKPETSVQIAPEPSEEEIEGRQRMAWERFVRLELRLEKDSPALHRDLFARLLGECPLEDIRRSVCEKVIHDGLKHLRALEEAVAKDVYIMHIVVTAADYIGTLCDVAQSLRDLKVKLSGPVLDRLPKENLPLKQGDPAEIEKRQRMWWENFIESRLRFSMKSPLVDRNAFDTFRFHCPFEDIRERVCYQLMDNGLERLRDHDKIEKGDIQMMFIILDAADKIGWLIDAAEELRRMKFGLPGFVVDKMPKRMVKSPTDSEAARERAKRDARRAELRGLRDAATLARKGKRLGASDSNNSSKHETAAKRARKAAQRKYQ